MLKSFLAPCFIHTLQLIFKNLLLKENNISSVKLFEPFFYSVRESKKNHGYFRYQQLSISSREVFIAKVVKI